MFQWRWVARSQPLVPLAVCGVGDAAVRLARRLLAMSDEMLGSFEGVCGKRLIAVRGPSDQLPWVRGVVYLGKDPAVKGYYLPTHLQPDIAGDWLHAALDHAQSPTPGVLLHEPQLRFGWQAARPVSRDSLQAWLDAL